MRRSSDHHLETVPTASGDHFGTIGDHFGTIGQSLRHHLDLIENDPSIVNCGHGRQLRDMSVVIHTGMRLYVPFVFGLVLYVSYWFVFGVSGSFFHLVIMVRGCVGLRCFRVRVCYFAFFLVGCVAGAFLSC